MKTQRQTVEFEANDVAVSDFISGIDLGDTSTFSNFDFERREQFKIDNMVAQARGASISPRAWKP